MQLSMLIGKQILTPAGERLGYVTGAYLDRELKKLSALAVADAEEEEFFMPARALIAYNDAVIANNFRNRAPTGVPSPVGLSAFSDKGELLGSVGDWLFGEEDAVLILVKDGVRSSVPVKNVLMGETVIVYPEPPKKRPAVTVRRPAPKKELPTEPPAPETEPAEVSVPENEPTLPQEEPATEPLGIAASEKEPSAAEKPAVKPIADAPAIPIVEKTASEPSAPPSAAPKRAVANEYSFNRYNLLGRKVKKSVFDDWGLPVALAGERITAETLSRARQCNRLLALTVNTLTNIW